MDEPDVMPSPFTIPIINIGCNTYPLVWERIPESCYATQSIRTYGLLPDNWMLKFMCHFYLHEERGTSQEDVSPLGEC